MCLWRIALWSNETRDLNLSMLKKEPQGLDSIRRTISQKVEFEGSKCGREIPFLAEIVKFLLEKFSPPRFRSLLLGLLL